MSKEKDKGKNFIYVPLTSDRPPPNRFSLQQVAITFRLSLISFLRRMSVFACSIIFTLVPALESCVAGAVVQMDNFNLLRLMLITSETDAALACVQGMKLEGLQYSTQVQRSSFPSPPISSRRRASSLRTFIVHFIH